MKKNGVKKLKAKIKKDLKNFMKDESGVMSKENVLKIGMGTIAALSMFSGIAKAAEPDPGDNRGDPGIGHGGMTHENDNTVKWITTGGNVKRVFPSHVHHNIHVSY